MSWGKRKHFILVLCIIVLAIFFRFIYLDRIPTSVTGDELHYAITAKYEQSKIFSVLTFHYPEHEQQAELPYFLHLITSNLGPFSLFLFKFPFALLGVGVVILLMVIAIEFFGLTTGIVTGFVAAVNPWLVVMSRTGYESMPASFFYLLGLYLLLKLKSWKILWAMVPLALGFYAYLGTKVIFLPFVVLALLLGILKNKKVSLRQYSIVFFLSVLLLSFFLFQLQSNEITERIGQLFFPSSTLVTQKVDEIRASSIHIPTLTLTVNRYTVYVEILISKILKIFSPSYLFIIGDQQFLPFEQGFMYYVDAIFIFFGLLSLYYKRKKLTWIIMGFILLGTFPHIISTTQSDFSNHLVLMFPFLILLIGIGILELSKNIPWVVIILLYAINVYGFATVYIYQYPITGSGDFPLRVLARYLYLAKQNKSLITLYSGKNRDVLNTYSFYTNREIQKIDTSKPFVFDGIHFTNCNSELRIKDVLGTLIYDTSCSMEIPGDTHIARLNDGGHVYTIINDTLCSSMVLHGYPTGLTLKDFAIEKLTVSQFCQTFITR